ncbi:MAG: class I SAM-dependent methyltransferase [Patescibacteria group bacterium]
MKCYCRASHTTLLFRSGLYDIVWCTSCGQVRTEVRAGVKQRGYYKEEDVRFYIDHQEMFRSLFRKLLGNVYKIAPKGRLLEIGAGVGLLLDEARKIGYAVIGFEPSKASVVAARKNFGITLIPREFHKSAFLRSQGRSLKNIDIIVINHVLEHLKRPKKVISLCAETLNRDGVLVIGVPNFQSFMCWIKRGKWQSLVPSQHRWQFSMTTLDQLVVPHGFRRVAVSYENHDRSIHYWWKRPIYELLDHVALLTGHAEAILVIYRKL